MCFGSDKINFVFKSEVWINRRTFDHLGRSKFELRSAYEKFDVWTGPYFWIDANFFKSSSVVFSALGISILFHLA